MSESRHLILQALVTAGVAVVAITEALSVFGWVTLPGLLLAWAVVAAAGAALLWTKGTPRLSIGHPTVLDALLIAGIVSIALIVGFIAVMSPPNSTDAMAYHLPRVVYWKQTGSVAFFPTSYLNQVMLPPLAEYMVLHTYVLSGSDLFANLVQYVGFLGSLIAVSLIAKELGAGRRGQIIAALFCATLPNGILQASGAKNEYLLALWLTAAVYFAVRRHYTWMALAVALALLTKGTAYLYAPAVLAGVILPRIRAEWKPLARTIPILLICVLALNGPQYLRNLHLSGSPLGYDSARGDGLFRWQNERFGVRVTISNALRHISDQLPARSEKWNQGVHHAVLRAHSVIGIDANDPATTWRWTEYAPPRNANHETNANNQWHLLLMVACFVPLALTVRRTHDFHTLSYYVSIAFAFLLFCAYLKWQPFQARMFLPLFVLSAPVTGLVLERLKPVVLQVAITLFLLNNTRPYLLENWIRPLKGPNSILKTARADGYFADMTSWNNKASYLSALELLRGSQCNEVGIDMSHHDLEYPLQALLLQERPGVRFQHTGVENKTAAYRNPATPPPCAVVCMECKDDKQRITQYAYLGPPVEAGSFVVFLKQ